MAICLHVDSLEQAGLAKRRPQGLELLGRDPAHELAAAFFALDAPQRAEAQGGIDAVIQPTIPKHKAPSLADGRSSAERRRREMKMMALVHGVHGY